jgi:hypothetical protein
MGYLYISINKLIVASTNLILKTLVCFSLSFLFLQLVWPSYTSLSEAVAKTRLAFEHSLGVIDGDGDGSSRSGTFFLVVIA